MSLPTPRGGLAPSDQAGGAPGRPRWDGARRELRVGEEVVKRFRQPALAQESILAEFERQGWPPRVVNPLPRGRSRDPKRHLRDTLKSLNRHQKVRRLLFEADGAGGVLWRVVEAEGSAPEQLV